MRVCVDLTAERPITLPLHYRYIVHSFIYRLLPNEYMEFLHDHGFVHGKRKMKLFTFSQIMGKSFRNGPFLVFQPPIRLYVSSPVEVFLKNLVNGLLQNHTISLHGQELKLSQLYFPPRPKLGNRVVFRTLSPITVYSTLTTANGKKKTYYYSPYEEEFGTLICRNLVRKASLLLGKEANGVFNIKPASNGNLREEIGFFKGTVIKGWKGIFIVEGDQLLIETGYEAGLGSKNSQGFGMVEVPQND